MLELAGQKGIYRPLVQADITRRLALPRTCAGIVRSGTFTAGHVGPEALPNLLAVALSGARLALSINLRVWTGAGFDRAFQTFAATGKITDLHLIEFRSMATLPHWSMPNMRRTGRQSRFFGPSDRACHNRFTCEAPRVSALMPDQLQDT